MVRRREALSGGSIQAKSREITGKLLQLAEFKACRNILFFMSLPGEVQTGEMIQKAFDLGKKVYVPLVDWKQRRLQVSEIPSLDIEFEEKRFGIREPGSVHINVVSPDVLDFALVPGVAFDKKGGRIGYGAGYYDKFLKEVSGHAVAVGVAYDFQVLDTIPQTQFDVPVQMILTEKKSMTC